MLRHPLSVILRGWAPLLAVQTKKSVIETTGGPHLIGFKGTSREWSGGIPFLGLSAYFLALLRAWLLGPLPLSVGAARTLNICHIGAWDLGDSSSSALVLH